jgi:hypothetical protein
MLLVEWPIVWTVRLVLQVIRLASLAFQSFQQFHWFQSLSGFRRHEPLELLERLDLL